MPENNMSIRNFISGVLFYPFLEIMLSDPNVLNYNNILLSSHMLYSISFVILLWS